MSREDRRKNRAHILEALQSETGSSGGDAAAKRVKAYIADPIGAPPEEFSFCGALILTRFYVDPQKPNTSEKRSLWKEMLTRIDQGSAADPGGWNGESSVSQLQLIVEQALGIE
jgi:hypothetical protein